MRRFLIAAVAAWMPLFPSHNPSFAAEHETPAAVWQADGAPGEFAHDFAALLYHDSLPSARDFARDRQDADGQIASLAYGVALFFEAAEGLVADLSRHGLLNHAALGIPFLRLPAPSNDAPLEMNYAKFRIVLQTFIDRLASAQEVLDRVSDPHIQLPLRPSLVRLDLDGDGVYAVEERVLPIFRALLLNVGQAGADWTGTLALLHRIDNPAERSDPAVIEEIMRRAPAFGYDGADAAWLQGYCRLLSAMVEILLAHDWEASFNQSFQLFFPQSDLPYAILNETYRRSAELNPGAQIPDHDIALALDIVSFAVHSPWRPTEPERLRAARAHLKGMIASSRESWRRIEAETDNLLIEGSPAGPTEWIPGPGQRTAAERQVSAGVVDGWRRFLQEFERMLDGDLLMPHWRFDRGVNLRRMFEDPRPFSPILMVQGADALYYLEDGLIADSAYMEEIIGLLNGDVMTYFFWFN